METSDNIIVFLQSIALIVICSTENLDNEYNIGDNIGVYAHVEPKKEKFIMEGPLKEDVVFFVIQHTLNTCTVFDITLILGKFFYR